jgi:hypothetical protein
VYGPKNTDSNFFIYVDVTYDESVGITISDIEISNYYKKPAILNGMIFESGNVPTQLRHEYFGKEMPRGFGSAFVIPGPKKPFYGNNDLSITTEVEIVVNIGGQNSQMWPKFTMIIPSLPNYKHFIETGEIPPANFHYLP